MPKLLDDDQVARYQRDGFVFPITVLDPPTAAHFRSRFEAYERKAILRALAACGGDKQKVARMLKRRLDKDPRWPAFTSRAAQIKSQLQLTDVAFLFKARFRNTKEALFNAFGHASKTRRSSTS